jgi:hypothetical protein
MANGDSFDPKRLAEYQSILQNIQVILEDITRKDQNLALTADQKTKKVAEEVSTFQQLVDLKFKEAQASGQALGNEEKRNLLLQQYRQGLQDQLAKITTSHHQNRRALRDTEAELKRINDQLTTLGTRTSANATQFDVLTRKQVSAHQEVLKLQGQQVDYNEAERQSIIQKITAEMQYTDAKLKSSQAVQSSMTLLFGLDNKWRQTLAGSLIEMTAAATKAQGIVGGLTSAAAHLSNTLSNVGSMGNVIGSSMMKVQEMTVTMVHSIDRADVGLRSATGAGKDFTTTLIGAFEDKDIRAMAGSFSELSQIQSQLFSISRAYSGFLPSQRLEMDRTALAAKRFGISINDTALVMDRSLRIFGITGPDMMNRLYNSAVAIGETPVRMVSNFNQAIDVMAQYSGPRAIQVLQGLSSMAKTTGIEINQLISVAMRFDTFEDAATSVSKLNAILGGAYFNSIQMLNASEQERLYLLRAGLDATNRSWQSLDRWEKKALAAAAGFQSMSTASAFFQGNMEKVADLTRKQEEQAESQRKLIQMGQGVVSIMDQIRRVMEDAGFAAKHIIDYVRGIVGVLKTLGFEGIVAVKLVWGLANSFAAAKLQAAALSSVLPGATANVSAMSIALRGIAPLLLAAGAAYLFFSSKMTEEKSPPAYALPGIIAQGFSSMAQSARKATPEISTLANSVNAINDKRVVDLTRALSVASQLSAPNMDFNSVASGVSELSRAINMLDEDKINSFSRAIGTLGAVMRSIPKETVVAVTQLTRESRAASAMPATVAARTGAQVSAQGNAVAVARASEAPRQGGQQRGQSGVLVTDSISVNVGGTILERKIEDVSRGVYSRMMRNA